MLDGSGAGVGRSGRSRTGPLTTQTSLLPSPRPPLSFFDTSRRFGALLGHYLTFKNTGSVFHSFDNGSEVAEPIDDGTFTTSTRHVIIEHGRCKHVDEDEPCQHFRLITWTFQGGFLTTCFLPSLRMELRLLSGVVQLHQDKAESPPEDPVVAYLAPPGESWAVALRALCRTIQLELERAADEQELRRDFCLRRRLRPPRPQEEGPD